MFTNFCLFTLNLVPEVGTLDNVFAYDHCKTLKLRINSEKPNPIWLQFQVYALKPVMFGLTRIDAGKK